MSNFSKINQSIDQSTKTEKILPTNFAIENKNKKQKKDPEYIIYMGKDKTENEELIENGLPEDIW